MENGHIVIVNQHADSSIGEVVNRLFKRYEDIIPYDVLRYQLRNRLKYQPIEKLPEDLIAKVGVRRLMTLFHGELYRVKKGLVYNGLSNFL